MDHTASALDDDAFQRELAPILIRALRTGSADELQQFVQRTLAHPKDPTAGTPLNADWHHQVQPPIPDRAALAVHPWGDVALHEVRRPRPGGGPQHGLATAEEDLRRLAASRSRPARAGHSGRRTTPSIQASKAPTSKRPKTSAVRYSTWTPRTAPCPPDCTIGAKS